MASMIRLHAQATLATLMFLLSYHSAAAQTGPVNALPLVTYKWNGGGGYAGLLSFTIYNQLDNTFQGMIWNSNVVNNNFQAIKGKFITKASGLPTLTFDRYNSQQSTDAKLIYQTYVLKGFKRKSDNAVTFAGIGYQGGTDFGFYMST